MTTRIWMIASIATAGACTSIGQDVVPDVVHAEIAADRTAPDELAVVDISLRLTAGDEADRTVDLWDVWLMETNRDVSEHQLRLAFPDGSVAFEPNEQRTIDLVNVGTTNADLLVLCHRSVEVLVNIRYLEEPQHGFADVERRVVKVACN